MRRPSPIVTWIALACFTLPLASSSAISVRELRAAPDLTPENFAGHFRNFKFEFRAKVQSPDKFLASRSGDCDDYSTLAAQILRERGYTPRLIAVRMPKIVHVVCYISETQSFLDYDLRGKKTPLQKSEPDIASIAAKVAKRYDSPWTSASEFTYHEGVKRLVATVLPSSNVNTAVASLKR